MPDTKDRRTIHIYRSGKRWGWNMRGGNHRVICRCAGGKEGTFGDHAALERNLVACGLDEVPRKYGPDTEFGADAKPKEAN